jgi:hypothetical protein
MAIVRIVGGRSVGFVNGLSRLDGLDDFDVFDRHGIYLQRILVENYEIRKLAGFDRSLRRVFGILIRGINSDGLQCFERRDPRSGR